MLSLETDLYKIIALALDKIHSGPSFKGPVMRVSFPLACQSFRFLIAHAVQWPRFIFQLSKSNQQVLAFGITDTFRSAGHHKEACLKQLERRLDQTDFSYYFCDFYHKTDTKCIY